MQKEEDMSGKSSRTKGASAEREFIKLLQPAVDTVYTLRGLEPPKLARNLEQTRNGGYDVVGIPWLALEVKRQEKLNIPAWWRQTLDQSGAKQIPVLAYRQNRKAWLVMTDIVAAGERITVTMALPHYMRLFKKQLEQTVSNEV